MELLWAIAGIVALCVLFTLLFNNPFKTPLDATKPDYEKGWKDFYK